MIPTDLLIIKATLSNRYCICKVDSKVSRIHSFNKTKVINFFKTVKS